METILHASIGTHSASPVKINFWKNLMIRADSQTEYKTAWYLFSLVFQGVFFLPIPAVLLYFYHASIFVLPVAFGFYMANIIIGMGGSGIRVVLGALALSILVNLSMLAFYIFF